MADAWWTYLAANWGGLIAPLVAFALTLAVGLVLRSLILRGVDRHAARTSSRVAQLFRETFAKPAFLWILLLAVTVGDEFVPITAGAQKRVDRYLLALWTISVTFAAAQFARQMVRLWGPQIRGEIAVTSLTENVARIVIFSVGGMILLNQWGLSITPILTALGVGGLAVALALQPTLSNLFSGISMSISGQIRPGDYVRLATSEEGYIQDVTWRSTTIRGLANVLIIIPNAKLADAVITNFHLPEKRVAVPIAVNVSYDADPEKVEAILLDIARKAIGEVPGLLAEPAPAVRFTPGFGEFALGFTLGCNVGEFAEQFLVISEMRKRILVRFREEGIEIPYVSRPGKADARLASAGLSTPAAPAPPSTDVR